MHPGALRNKGRAAPVRMGKSFSSPAARFPAPALNQAGQHPSPNSRLSPWELGCEGSKDSCGSKGPQQPLQPPTLYESPFLPAGSPKSWGPQLLSQGRPGFTAQQDVFMKFPVFSPNWRCSSVRTAWRLAARGSLQKRGSICRTRHAFCASERVFGVGRSLPRSTALPAALQHPLGVGLQHLSEVPAPSRPTRGGSPLCPRPPP